LPRDIQPIVGGSGFAPPVSDLNADNSSKASFDGLNSRFKGETPGAEAFKRDIKDAEVHLLDAGHLAIETETKEIAGLMLRFLERNGI